MWHQHKCFVNMGNHWFNLNYDVNQSCDTVFPVQLLYDHQSPQPLVGFVWQHFALLEGDLWDARNNFFLLSAILPSYCLSIFSDGKLWTSLLSTTLSKHHLDACWMPLKSLVLGLCTFTSRIIWNFVNSRVHLNKNCIERHWWSLTALLCDEHKVCIYKYWPFIRRSILDFENDDFFGQGSSGIMTLFIR